jgi:hypothetical protein
MVTPNQSQSGASPEARRQISRIYVENGDPKRRWGDPELLLSYPATSCSLEDLPEFIEIALNKYSCEIEELIQPRCSEGYAEFDVAEGHEDARFTVFAEEVVNEYYRIGLKVVLSCPLDAKGIHLHVLKSEQVF